MKGRLWQQHSKRATLPWSVGFLVSNYAAHSVEHLAVVRREQALKAFKAGCISLAERASVDESCDAALQRIRSEAAAVHAQLPDDVQLICRPPVASYHINLSGLRTPLLHVLPRCAVNAPLLKAPRALIV